MISTSFITGAGLKKCMPMTWLGRWVATEISVTDSEQVLVARIASGVQTRSSSAKIRCLRSRCSGTASMTRSTLVQRRRSPTAKSTRPSSASRSAAAELALGHRAIGRAGQVGPAPLQRRLADLDGDHATAVAGEDLDDAGAHGAQPDHTDRIDLASHGLSLAIVKSESAMAPLAPTESR